MPGVLRTLHQARLGGPITPHAQGYDALQLFASAANGVNAYDSGSIRTFIKNANFEGLLGTYDYTSSDHEGFAPCQHSPSLPSIRCPMGSTSWRLPGNRNTEHALTRS